MFRFIVALVFKLLGPLFGHSAAETCKKRSGRLALNDYDFSSCLDAFLSFKRPQSFKKGVWQRFFQGSACRRVLFANCWTPFRSLSGPISSKRGLAVSFLDLPDLTFRFSAAGPVFGPSAARMGPPQPPFRLASFPAAGPLFVPGPVWILQEGV